MNRRFSKLIPLAVALALISYAVLPSVAQSAPGSAGFQPAPEKSQPLISDSKSDPDWEEETTTSKVETKDGRTVLKLGVEHATTLSPIPDSLQAGSIFNEKLLGQRNDKLNWYRIPKWLAAQWKRMSETTVYSHDYESKITDREPHTFMSEQTAEFGVQQDSSGQYWNCNLSPTAVSDRGSYKAIALVQFKQPVKTTDKEIVFKEVYTVVHVVKESNLIIDSFLIESYTRHRPCPDGSLDTDMSVEVYNAGGRPRRVQENTANDRKSAPVELVNTYKGRDIKADFARFLQSQNLANLIP